MFITYFENENVIKHFNKIKLDITNNRDIDLYCIYDISRADINSDSQLNYNLIKINKDIITKDGFEFNQYNVSESADFYGHNFELIQLYFYKNHPEYDYYWIIEYDVWFTGNYNDLFSIEENADYICSNIKYRNPEQYSLYCVYKTFDPIHKDIHAFNPIFRMSNRAFKLISDLYKMGNHGNYEHFFPCTLKHFNYKIISFNELGYVGGLSNNELSDSTMNYLKRFTENDVTLKNTLYHPIK